MSALCLRNTLNGIARSPTRKMMLAGGCLALLLIIVLSIALSRGVKYATGALVGPTRASVINFVNTNVNCSGTTGWNVTGEVHFEQGPRNETVTVSINLRGLPPSGQHGFHVHTAGATTNACLDAGAHFNPLGNPHEGPMNATRHVGDLGNIVSDASGNAVVAYTDDVISLTDSVRGIVGRSIVVHCLRDDLGLGSSVNGGTSNTTGNAGARLACGVIDYEY